MIIKLIIVIPTKMATIDTNELILLKTSSKIFYLVYVWSIVGYFCVQYAEVATPRQGVDADICPRGYYCPIGTSSPQACAKGTYSNSTGLVTDTDCIWCDSGMACTQTHLTEPNAICDPGLVYTLLASCSNMK